MSHFFFRFSQMIFNNVLFFICQKWKPLLASLKSCHKSVFFFFFLIVQLWFCYLLGVGQKTELKEETGSSSKGRDERKEQWHYLSTDMCKDPNSLFSSNMLWV